MEQASTVEDNAEAGNSPSVMLTEPGSTRS
jgi:hypothetical protein